MSRPKRRPTANKITALISISTVAAPNTFNGSSVISFRSSDMPTEMKNMPSNSDSNGLMSASISWR